MSNGINYRILDLNLNMKTFLNLTFPLIVHIAFSSLNTHTKYSIKMI